MASRLHLMLSLSKHEDCSVLPPPEEATSEQLGLAYFAAAAPPPSVARVKSSA